MQPLAITVLPVVIASRPGIKPEPRAAAAVLLHPPTAPGEAVDQVAAVAAVI